MDQRARDIGDQRFARLWCFGYDMNKMQARCWYDHTLPLFGLDETQRENVLSWAGELIDAAGDIAKTLQTQVKSAWFSRPGDVKTDDVRGVLRGVVKEFWQQSEPVFYNLLERLIGLPGNQRLAPPDIYDTWVRMIQALAYSLFDIWTLEAPAEDLDMKRIIAARLSLTKKMNHSGQMKTLFAKANSGKGLKMQQAQHYRFLKDAETRDSLKAWWNSLKQKRGDRARLRRAERPEDVLLTEAFFNFLQQMPESWAKPEELLSSAIVAAALSHVKEPQDDGKNFITRLASPKRAGDKTPRMSELRFQRLQKSHSPEEFFIRLQRAIRLSEGKADVLSLSESILHWMSAFNSIPEREPQKRLAVIWAIDYYTALPKQNKKGEKS